MDSKLNYNPKRPTLIRYERNDDLLRITLKNFTNHELREVLVGLWSRLEPADRTDHIRELTHYDADPESFLSPVAAAIKQGPEGSTAIDLDELIKRGEKIRP